MNSNVMDWIDNPFFSHQKHGTFRAGAFCKIIMCADDKGVVRVSVRDLASILGVEASRAVRVIEGLVEAGLIAKQVANGVTEIQIKRG